jgi:hypothetical protein
MDGIRVDECDLEPEETFARPCVDQVGARTGQLGQRLVEIPDLIGHVVHPGPALGEEAANRRVLAERLEQLHPTGADANGRRADALSLDRRAVLDPRPEQLLVGRKGGVEVFDRNSQMMNPPRLHASDAIRSAV